MKNKGFTLIELMIVIAIIAIIAAIAIPNLREAQRNANESAAVTTMRQYLSAQGTYHRTDYDGDGAKEYASVTTQLYDWAGDGSGVIKLVDLATARAVINLDGVVGYSADGTDDTGAPRSGYRFMDHTEDDTGTEFESPTGDDDPVGWSNGFGLTGVPERYNRTGLKTFVINDEGVVYERAIADCEFNAGEGNWSEEAPVGFPDAATLQAAGWIMVGE